MTPVMVQPAVLPPVWTTPQILKTSVVAIWLACILLMTAAISGARSHRRAMQMVGRDAAPSIVAAQHIRAALADMDANAANELLNSKDAPAARLAFEMRREETISAIVSAAENITYGDTERVPIRKLALGVGTYVAGIQTARDRHEAGDRNFLTAWRMAASYMNSTLLPAAAELDRANETALEETYARQKAASVRAMIFLILAGAALGAILFLLQAFLLRRMRRVLNPLLFLATLAAFIFVVYAGQRFVSSDADLKVAKEDAFNSIHALWQARALAYSANGDESRYLLDAGQSPVYEKDFKAKSEAIDKFLSDELRNITFEGEDFAARNTAGQFGEYQKIDEQIRDLEKSGKHDAAIALCIGSGPRQSNQVFALFDKDLDRTLSINQSAFDAAVTRGFKEVDSFEVTAPVVASVISLLAWLGLRARIREYAA
jgi:hypothetical protein